MSRWPLRVTQDRRDGILVISLTGRISHASAGLFRRTLDEAIQRGAAHLVIDLGGVDYLSSSALPILQDVHTRLAAIGGALVLCGLTETVRIVLDLSGLLPQLAVEPSVDVAITRVK